MNAEYGDREDAVPDVDTSQALEAYRKLARNMEAELHEPADERVLRAGQKFINDTSAEDFDNYLDLWRTGKMDETAQKCFDILLDRLMIKRRW